MARRSFQRGSVRLKKRRNAEPVWVLRYRVRDPNSKSGWKEKTEMVPECRTKKEALNALNERLLSINQSNNRKRPSMPTFASFSSGLWQAYTNNKRLKPSTVYSYKSMLDNIVLPQLGKHRLDEIGPEDLTQLMTKLERGGKSMKTLLNLYSMLRVMFEVAVEYDLIDISPVRRKLHRPQYARKEKPALSAEAIRQIIENISEKHQTLFVCVALTGMRLGELLALRWMNVDFTSHRLAITHSLWRGQLVSPKTKASERTIHLVEVLADLLLDHRQKSAWCGESDYVFCGESGAPLDPDNLRHRVLYPALEAVGIKRQDRMHGFHLFRHSAGSIVHALTRDLKAAQELLGHSRISTTSDIYVHLDKSVAEEATEALAKAIIPNCGLVVAQGSDRIQ